MLCASQSAGGQACFLVSLGFPVAQRVKNLPIMQKTWEEALILRCLCSDISDESAVSLAATVSLEKT